MIVQPFKIRENILSYMESVFAYLKKYNSGLDSIIDEIKTSQEYDILVFENKSGKYSVVYDGKDKCELIRTEYSLLKLTIALVRYVYRKEYKEDCSLPLNDNLLDLLKDPQTAVKIIRKFIYNIYIYTDYIKGYNTQETVIEPIIESKDGFVRKCGIKILKSNENKYTEVQRFEIYVNEKADDIVSAMFDVYSNKDIIIPSNHILRALVNKVFTSIKDHIRHLLKSDVFDPTLINIENLIYFVYDGDISNIEFIKKAVKEAI